MNSLVYLKPNLVVEPLVDGWYAWPHLISPATFAMNTVGRHLSIIDSYLATPEIHEAAIKSPRMRGGPFMDFGGESKIEEVQKLRKSIIEDRKSVLSLANAIKDLEKLLLAEAKGLGLEDTYKKVPDSLKGYVELFYDRNNNPGFRFFECLLYKSEFYQESAQSVALWVTNNDQRPFCLSTPKVPSNEVLHLKIPFKSKLIDQLAMMKRKPNSLAFIKELFQIEESNERLFESFFTSEAPKAYSRYTGNHIRMRYFGHACILIETRDVSILVDPLISYYGYTSDVNRFSDADLPDTIDYVLITHNHQDHIMFETMLPLRHRIKNIIVPQTCSGRLEDPDLKMMLNNIGFDNVQAIGEMETIAFSDANITAIPFTGEHCDLNILTKSCHLVEIDGLKLMFLADSRIIEPELYKHIHKFIGNVDVLFLGMECDGAPLSWLYGPLMPKVLPRNMDNSRRLSGSDCKAGLELVKIFNPREVYVYAMGQEPWVEFITSVKYTDESNPIVQSNLLVRTCREMGISAERLFGEKEILYDRPPSYSGIV